MEQPKLRYDEFIGQLEHLKDTYDEFRDVLQHFIQDIEQKKAASINKAKKEF